MTKLLREQQRKPADTLQCMYVRTHKTALKLFTWCIGGAHSVVLCTHARYYVYQVALPGGPLHSYSLQLMVYYIKYRLPMSAFAQEYLLKYVYHRVSVASLCLSYLKRNTLMHYCVYMVSCTHSMHEKKEIPRDYLLPAE